MSTTSMNVVFDKNYNYSTIRPSRTDYVFLEWVLPDGTTPSDTGYWRTAGNVTLTAKWLKTEASVSFRQGYLKNKTKDPNWLVTDNDKVYDKVDLGFDRVTLVKQGYTKVRIHIYVDLYGENKGNRDMWLRPYNNKTGGAMDHYDTSTDDNQWEAMHNTFIDININNSGFSDTLAFWMEYGANGDLGDDWYLADTTITITVIK